MSSIEINSSNATFSYIKNENGKYVGNATPVVEDFEDSTYNFSPFCYYDSNNGLRQFYGIYTDTNEKHGGTQSIYLRASNDEYEHFLRFSIPAGGVLNFWLKVTMPFAWGYYALDDPYSDYDGIKGAQKIDLRLVTSDWVQHTVQIPSDSTTHYFYLYLCDNYYATKASYIWIDDMSFTPNMGIVSQDIDTSAQKGQKFYIPSSSINNVDISYKIDDATSWTTYTPDAKVVLGDKLQLQVSFKDSTSYVVSPFQLQIGEPSIPVTLSFDTSRKYGYDGSLSIGTNRTVRASQNTNIDTKKEKRVDEQASVDTNRKPSQNYTFCIETNREAANTENIQNDTKRRTKKRIYALESEADSFFSAKNWKKTTVMYPTNAQYTYYGIDALYRPDTYVHEVYTDENGYEMLRVHVSSQACLNLRKDQHYYYVYITGENPNSFNLYVDVSNGATITIPPGSFKNLFLGDACSSSYISGIFSVYTNPVQDFILNVFKVENCSAQNYHFSLASAIETADIDISSLENTDQISFSCLYAYQKVQKEWWGPTYAYWNGSEYVDTDTYDLIGRSQIAGNTTKFRITLTPPLDAIYPPRLTSLDVFSQKNIAQLISANLCVDTSRSRIVSSNTMYEAHRSIKKAQNITSETTRQIDIQSKIQADTEAQISNTEKGSIGTKRTVNASVVLLNDLTECVIREISQHFDINTHTVITEINLNDSERYVVENVINQWPLERHVVSKSLLNDDTLQKIYASQNVLYNTNRKMQANSISKNDTDRKTSAPITFGADAKRNIAISAYMSTGTYRKVFESIVYNYDTDRKVQMDILRNFDFDAKREICIPASFHIGTKRFSVNTENINNDTRAQIIYSLSLCDDTKRENAMNIDFAIETDRKTAVSDMYSVGTQRLSVYATSTLNDTLAHIIKGNNLATNTETRIIVPIQIDVDTLTFGGMRVFWGFDAQRTTMASQNLCQDTLKKSIKNNTLAIETNRKSTVYMNRNIDTIRQACPHVLLGIGTLQNVIKSINLRTETDRRILANVGISIDTARTLGILNYYVYDTHRKVITYGIPEIDTKRIVKVSISEEITNQEPVICSFGDENVIIIQADDDIKKIIL